jgi:RimJ/RimL family protein N-acetyltransferase
MSSSVLYDNEEVARWIMEVIGTPYYGYRTAGLVRDGEIIAGILCDRFGIRECQMHIATKEGSHWATRDNCAIAFGYVFNYLRRERVTVETPVSNTRMVRVNDHLGFMREGVKRCVTADGGDAIIFGMLKDECRWLKEST